MVDVNASARLCCPVGMRIPGSRCHRGAPPLQRGHWAPYRNSAARVLDEARLWIDALGVAKRHHVR